MADSEPTSYNEIIPDLYVGDISSRAPNFHGALSEHVKFIIDISNNPLAQQWGSIRFTELTIEGIDDDPTYQLSFDRIYGDILKSDPYLRLCKPKSFSNWRD